MVPKFLCQLLHSALPEHHSAFVTQTLNGKVPPVRCTAIFFFKLLYFSQLQLLLWLISNVGSNLFNLKDPFVPGSGPPATALLFGANARRVATLSCLAINMKDGLSCLLLSRTKQLPLARTHPPPSPSLFCRCFALCSSYLRFFRLPLHSAATSLAIIAETNEKQEAERKPRGLVSSHRCHSYL